VIKVPAEHIHDARLSLAAAGLPRGGSVGYELFDESDFGTTEFVQKMNYQRALQGELSRTIREIEEVEDARVMIVMPKDSIFIEETKPPSASVLLKLRRDMSQESVNAVVHLVASAIEGMTPDLVTVVDTKGRVLFKATHGEQMMGELANTHLKHKTTFEKNLARRIQTMLERIVGDGKAIVRVTADMDFNQVDINEELFDPDVQLIRSRQNLAESGNTVSGPKNISSVNPVVPPGGGPGAGETVENNSKQDETVNYELNRTIRRTIRPVGGLNRLSVAVVLDGKYVIDTDERGEKNRKYVARSAEELNQFQKIVQNAMGYSSDREDQVTVESFAFSYIEDMGPLEPELKTFVRQYWRTAVNLVLALLLLFVLVLPLLKAMREIKSSVMESLPPPGEARKGLPDTGGAGAMLGGNEMEPRDKAAYFAEQDFDKTVKILKGWAAGGNK
jgi:flagellar M-ring protein FliF